MQISNSQLANVALYASFSNNSQKSATKQEYENANSKANVFAQSPYSITAPRVEKVLQEGKIESLYPSVSQTPFSSALSQKQGAVSESAYNEAIKRISELMNELSAFVAAKQGDSELAYFLDAISVFFAGQAKFNDENLNAIKNQINDSKSDDKDIINAINAYFTLGASTAENAIRFFDYASDKIKGLPVAQIMQDLSTIKGWWDNNSRECLKLDDGTKVGFTHAFDKDGNITNTTLVTSLPNGVQRKFNTANLDDENSQILFEMFKKRENLNGLESENLRLNSSENSNLQTKLNLTNSNLQASYTINTPRKQVSFREGVSYEFEYPQNANTPFSNAVSAAQPVVSENEYNQALSRIKDLMDEIVAFVISEQGTDSELGFNLDQMDKHFTAQMESNSVKLDMLKSQIKNYNGDDKLIINTMQSYFAFGGQTATHYIAKFFDYASDKIENLPVAQIVQDLSIVKGYWDNNTEQGFVIEGKKLSLSQIFNEKTKRYQTKLNIDNIEFSDINFNSTSDKFESKKFEILLGIFEKREKISVQNSNANLSKTNSNDSLLKALLSSVSNDENLLKDLKV